MAIDTANIVLQVRGSGKIGVFFAIAMAVQATLAGCLGGTPLKVTIFVLSPPPSTCSLPRPSQASQPCHSGPRLLSSVVTKWGVVSKFLKMSSWQVLQVSAPT